MNAVQDVCENWSRFLNAEAEPLGEGLINKTYLITRGEQRAVLQSLHAIFDGRVCDDIDTVTAHLASHDLPTPRLICTDDGARSVEHEGNTWRAMSYVEGKTVHKLEDKKQAQAAGHLVGRFHKAMEDYKWGYAKQKRLAHDTLGYVARLEQVAVANAEHANIADIVPIAREIFAAANALPDFSALPDRHAHGDLKISNLLFDDKGAGLCLVDLDTLGRMKWVHEMGDAVRNWCNTGAEDASEADIDLDLLKGALKGYGETAKGMVTKEETAALIDGAAAMALELSTRFLTDVLEDSYFGWDEERYETRAAHNLARAKGQWALHNAIVAKKKDAEKVVKAAKLS